MRQTKVSISGQNSKKILGETQVHFLSNSDCQKVYMEQNIDQSQFCAFSPTESYNITQCKVSKKVLTL